MSKRFLYVYLIGATLALGLLIYSVITTYPKLDYTDLGFDLVPAIALYYMAYKVYHEKKDGELM